MVNLRKNVVTFTTFEVINKAFGLISPLLCRGCGAKGEALCDCCKKYIISNIKPSKIEEEGGRVFEKAEYLGFRDEILGELVEEYKYMSMRKIGGVLAEIIYRTYCLGNREIVFVPMPTSLKHIRERGFDHMDLVVREVERLARKDGGNIEVLRLLGRAKDTVQVGADEETRRKQAKEAVELSEDFISNKEEILKRIKTKKLVLVDDVWTTGASLTEAGKKLKRAGVKKIYALAIVRNRQGRNPEIRRGEF